MHTAQVSSQFEFERQSEEMEIGGEMPARSDSSKIAIEPAAVWNGQHLNLGTCDYLFINILTLREMMEMEMKV